MNTIYNFEYLPALVEKAGYDKEMDYLTYRIPIHGAVSPTIEKIAEWIKRRGGLTLLEFEKKGEALRHLPEVGDGPTAPGERAGRACRIGQKGPYAEFAYFYFDVDDGFAFDESGQPFTVDVTYFDAGHGQLSLQYDSTDPAASVAEGAFKEGGRIALGDSRQWKAATFRVEDARFLNRTHGGDFRIAAFGQNLAIASVGIRRQ